MSPWDFVNFQHQFAALPEGFYRPVTPQPLKSIQWAIWNGELAACFGLPKDPTSDVLQRLAAQFNGEDTVHPFYPIAMKYAGHQFGSYNPDLGDGRGLLLGEMQHVDGSWYDLHSKGSGLTPFSRMGDGRAVIRSTVREYLASEALAGLGLATTRALGMLISDTPVYREQQERGALLLRVAQTHIRFGHFEHFFYTRQHQALTLLADKVIEWHYPKSRQSAKPYLAMFEAIVTKTATMIAQWQAYGFNHGVMNTDNMSIVGETFDFGPFAFLDDYDAHYVCNHSDYQGRYAFSQQPAIGLWNLTALAQALSPLIDIEDMKPVLDGYQTQLTATFSQLMRKKLGLISSQAGDTELFSDMFTLLQTHQIDYTRFLRTLSELDRYDAATVCDLAVERQAVETWLNLYLKRCELESDQRGFPLSTAERCDAMRRVNPKFVLRNYLAQNAIAKAEQGEFDEVEKLAKILARPFDDQPENQTYANLPPQWGKAMAISCSS